MCRYLKSYYKYFEIYLIRFSLLHTKICQLIYICNLAKKFFEIVDDDLTSTNVSNNTLRKTKVFICEVQISQLFIYFFLYNHTLFTLWTRITQIIMYIIIFKVIFAKYIRLKELSLNLEIIYYFLHSNLFIKDAKETNII